MLLGQMNPIWTHFLFSTKRTTLPVERVLPKEKGESDTGSASLVRRFLLLLLLLLLPLLLLLILSLFLLLLLLLNFLLLLNLLFALLLLLLLFVRVARLRGVTSLAALLSSFRVGVVRLATFLSLCLSSECWGSLLGWILVEEQVAAPPLQALLSNQKSCGLTRASRARKTRVASTSTALSLGETEIRCWR